LRGALAEHYPGMVGHVLAASSAVFTSLVPSDTTLQTYASYSVYVSSAALAVSVFFKVQTFSPSFYVAAAFS